MLHLRLLAMLLTATALPALSLWDSGDPTPAEQQVLEVINRARVDPAAEATRLVILPDITEGVGAAVPASPPLAMNRTLLQIARTHSQYMWTNNTFSHNTLAGVTPSQRMTAAGYTWTSAGENIATSTNSSASALEDALMIDLGYAGRGHRKNLLDVGINYREVGIGYYHNGTANPSGWRSFLTQDFGSSATGPFLLGVVYADADSDGFYDIGEGMSGVLVSPSSGSWGALTGQAGGYAFPVGTSGTVTVTYSGGGLTGLVIKTVVLGATNVKQNVFASEAVAGGGSAPATPASAATVSDTTSATPVLSGTTVALATVTIFDGATAIGVTTANASGVWTWTPTTPLVAGAHSLTWKASNTNGTSGASPAVVVTVAGGSSAGGSVDGGGGGGGCGAGTPAIGMLFALLLLGLRRTRRVSR